jgi:AbiV family abortive infection protein
MADPGTPRQYVGDLNSQTAASAMQAARLNATELLDTADLLFNLKRFQHSMTFSILAIEEVGKLAILQGILLSLGGTREQLWRSYRLHRAKTERLNAAILGRVRATFLDISLEQAKEIAERGPTPDELESAKQRALYSDCLEHQAHSSVTFRRMSTGGSWPGNDFARLELSSLRSATEPLKSWICG